LKSRATGVRQEEQALTSVWCTHGARSDNCPFRIEPELVKVTEHPSEGVSISNESCDVFHEDVAGSNHA
jgi:hypothetical protein